jgi:hypothetical protein
MRGKSFSEKAQRRSRRRPGCRRRRLAEKLALPQGGSPTRGSGTAKWPGNKSRAPSVVPRRLEVTRKLFTAKKNPAVQPLIQNIKQCMSY